MAVERRGDVRVLAGTPATAKVTFYQAGVIADPGVVTVSGTRLNGESFTPAASPAGTGASARTVTLSATELADLDTITLTWTSPMLGAVTTRVVVEGDQLFSIAEARAFDVGATGGKVLESATTYPDDLIAEARSRIAEAFEHICEVAFTPQARMAVLDGGLPCTLILPDLRVLSVEAVHVRDGSSWQPVDLDDLDLDGGPGILHRVRGEWPAARRSIRVHYIHGYERVPEDIRRAALILCRTELVASNVSDRTTSMSNDAGTFRLATAGMTKGSWFGVPLVDSVLQRYVERVPRVG